MATNQPRHLILNGAKIAQESAATRRRATPGQMKALANKIGTGFTVAVIVMSFFAFTAWYTASRHVELFHQVQRSTKFGEYLEQTLIQVLNMETGVRGYVISGDENFLEPYNIGRAEVTNSLAMAIQWAPKDPQTEQRLATLSALIQEKLSVVDKNVELRRAGNETAARQRVSSGEGKRIMDQIRILINDLEKADAAVLAERLNQSETEARRTIYIVSVSGLLAVLAVAASGFLVQRDLNRRRKAEAALETQSNRLALATRAGNIGVWDWNIATGEVFWDDTLYALLGLRPEQTHATYDLFMSLLHPDDRQRVEHDVQMALLGEKDYAAEFRVVWGDKSVHYLQANSIIIRDESGKAQRVLGTNWDVTRRKLEEKKFRDVLEAAPDGIVITARNGAIVVVNAEAEKLFGYSKDELIGKPVDILVPSRLRAAHMEHRAEFVVSPNTRRMGAGRNLLALRKDETEFPVEVSLSPLETEEGLLVIAIVRDITDRMRVEKALRDSATQQQQLAERLGIERARLAEAQAVGKLGSWELDLRNNVLVWSEENYRIFGMDPATFGASYEAFLGLIFPDDRGAVDKAYSDSVASRRPYAIDHRIQLLNGTIKWVHERCETFYDEQGRPVRSVGTTQDITERKKAEETLRVSEETMRLMAESMPQIVWMCRPDGWNIYFNQQWVDYTGLTFEQSYGHGWNVPFHPDDKGRAWEAWKNTTERGEKYDLECRLRRFDGVYRWFLIRAVPVRNKDGTVLKWFGTCTDIQDMKEAEQKIHALNLQLEHHSANLEQQVSERTAALRDSIRSLETLTYTMAHDLRAPVRAITTYADALFEDCPTNAKSQEYIAQIHQNADRMQHLISDLLDYGRLGHLEFPMKPIDLQSQIDKVLARFAAEIRATNAEVEVRSNAPMICANERLLSSVLSNFLSNALKFVAPGVKPRVRLRAETRDGFVRLWIEDNGIGIAPEHQDKIFGVFHRLHTPNEYPGTGVGLAVVKRAVDLMKGHVGLESQIGKGSKFWFELPIAKLDGVITEQPR